MLQLERSIHRSARGNGEAGRDNFFFIKFGGHLIIIEHRNFFFYQSFFADCKINNDECFVRISYTKGGIKILFLG